MGQLSMSVQERFSHVQASCSQLAAANENTSARVAEVLREADGFVAEVGAAWGDWRRRPARPGVGLLSSVWG